MGNTWGDNHGIVCPTCGLRYDRFKTGLKYRDVHEMMRDGSDDPADWRYKRKHTVLGLWHQIKQERWQQHVDECAAQAAHDAQMNEPGDAWEPPAAQDSREEGVPF